MGGNGDRQTIIFVMQSPTLSFGDSNVVAAAAAEHARQAEQNGITLYMGCELSVARWVKPATIAQAQQVAEPWRRADDGN